MKVSELIEKLQAQNPEHLVILSGGGPARHRVTHVAVERVGPDAWGADACSASYGDPKGYDAVFVTSEDIP